mmetsp:Transcript_15598/g.38164  ORF Transcript_15598/g.38164 Transcript_15598/m.38164 type:complete len:97 (+) Transcript_15598:39-329(+)
MAEGEGEGEEKGNKEEATRTDWIALNGEVRGVRVNAKQAHGLEEFEDERPCGSLLDSYVECVRDYNIELCDDEKFLYRKCIRAYVERHRVMGQQSS